MCIIVWMRVLKIQMEELKRMKCIGTVGGAVWTVDGSAIAVILSIHWQIRKIRMMEYCMERW
jgi:hypothetical protein